MTIPSLPTIRRAALIAITAALVAGAATACSGGDAGPEDVVLAIDTSTPTPTPTPSPTPTPEPKGPIPAATVAPGPTPGLVNPSSIGFPAPPSATRISSENRAGLVRIVSPDLGIDSHIEIIGVVDGKMESPDEDGSYAVGWYAPTAQYGFGIPGNGGNVVLSAHETWNHMRGPFYKVHEAAIGTDIYLDMADGERRHYQVIRVTRYPVDGIPMDQVLWPDDRPKLEEWLTLYTCGGEIIYGDRGFGDYLARDVLVAVWVGSEEIPATTAPEPTATTASAVMTTQ